MTEHKDLIEQRREELGEEAVAKAMDSSVSQIILHVNKQDPNFKSFIRTDYHSGRSETEFFDKRKKKKVSWTKPVIRKWEFIKNFMLKR